MRLKNSVRSMLLYQARQKDISISGLSIFLVLILIFFISNTSAMQSHGTCDDTEVIVGSTCQASGFLNETGGTSAEYAVWNANAVDCNVTPKQANIRAWGFWNPYGTYTFDEVVQLGDTLTLTNPNDDQDFMQATVDGIFCGGDFPSVHFSTVNYQQTFHLSSGGNDNNWGTTSGNAWKNLAHALTILKNGTDLYIESGINDNQYPGSPLNGGLINSPIIIRGNGEVSYLVWNETSYITGAGWDYYEFRNFNVYGISNYGVLGGFSYAIYDNMTSYGTINANGQGHNIVSNSNLSGYYIVDMGGWDEYYNNIINPSEYSIHADAGIFHNNIVYPLTYVDVVSAPQTGFYNNYWFDYTGIDLNGDKIGDTPFIYGGINDTTPLMDRESGYVFNSVGDPISNVTVYQVGATYRNTTTGTNGEYALSTIGRNNISLNATKSGYQNGSIIVPYDFQGGNFTLLGGNPYPVFDYWVNNITNNNSLYIYSNETFASFTACSNQSIDSWTIIGANSGSSNSTCATAETNLVIGIHNISIYGENVNGTTQNLTWTINVIQGSSSLLITAWWNNITGWNQNYLTVTAGSGASFDVTINQIPDYVIWKDITENETIILQNSSASPLDLYFASGIAGVFNLTAQAFNQNGSSNIVSTVITIELNGTATPTPTPTITSTPTPTITSGTPTPTATTANGITPGSTTDADIDNYFWDFLFITIVLYGIAFFWTIGDKE